jgi:hypothetical protein
MASLPFATGLPQPTRLLPVCLLQASLTLNASDEVHWCNMLQLSLLQLHGLPSQASLSNCGLSAKACTEGSL